MYRKVPTEAEAAMYGLTVEEATSKVDLWPDNAAPVNVFISLLTQWRVGVNGATGLDYGVLPVVLRLNGIPRKEWPDLFADIRTMEDEALRIMREQREKAERQKR